MNLIQLLPIGMVSGRLLGDLSAGLSSELRARCEILKSLLDPDPAFHPVRQQYFSTELLARMQGLRPAHSWRLLGVTALDLYIPILTFVFGEAELNGACAVVSAHRLRQEFYGLPSEPELLRARLLKEAVHELGHTLGLAHCADYHCVMAPSHAVEWLDIKGSSFCPDCRVMARASGQGF